MTSLAYIAWRYVTYHWGRSLTLVAILAVCVFLPATLSVLTQTAERQMTKRADETPLLIGAKGSELDLAMNALYFQRADAETIAFSELTGIDDSQLAYGIPLYARFSARGYPIVGTSLDYFDFRQLAFASGRKFGLLGEAVLGSNVAAQLGLSPGSSLVSTPETLFDIAGVYPLKMKVSGVLAPRGSADDSAVFVDYRTAWIIQGLGHGHQDLASAKDPTIILKRKDGTIVANAKLTNTAEITPETVSDFHFHGDLSAYPLSAVLAVPDDVRAEAILRGRYEEAGAQVRAIKPGKVVRGLMQEIFRIKQLLDGILLLVGIAVLLALMLVFSLSLRLRREEMSVNRRIGASRSIGALLVGAEIVILSVIGGLAGLILTAGVASNSQAIIQYIIQS